MATAAQISANRINAQSSTGPRSVEGKHSASRNALEHGLASGFIVLPHEDPAAYHSLHTQYIAEFHPEGAHEEFLVEEMAQARWRLSRARRLEGQLFSDYADSGAANPDHAILSAMEERSTNVANTLARYAAAAERSYYKAHRTLTSDRKAEARIEQADLRNEAKVAEVERLDAVLEAITPRRQWTPEENQAWIDGQIQAAAKRYPGLFSSPAPASNYQTKPKSA